MSTTAEIERMPLRSSRSFIQAGVGAVGSMPSIVRLTKRGQPAASSTRTGRRRFDVTGAAAMPGSASGAPVIAATLARDAEERQAIGAIGRELQRDQRVVERERVAQVGADAARRPAARAGPTRRRRCRVPSPSTASRATRRRASSPCLIARPPGSAAPTVAHGTLHAGGGIGRAADDRERRAGAGVDGADAQPVGVRMRRDGVDRGRRRRRERRRGAARPPRLRARPSSARSHSAAESSGGSASVRSQRSENFIAGSRYANCRRNPRSFS